MNWLESGKTIAIIVLFLSVSASNGQTTATSQQKAITKKDFEEVDKKAKEFLKSNSYRFIRTTESLINDPQKSKDITKRTEEYLPPNLNRLLFETTESELSRTEWITIGKDHFQRDGDGAWTKSSKNKRPSPFPFSVLKREYFSEVPIVVDGKNVNVFVVKERTKTEVIRAPLVVVGMEQGKIKFKTSEIICSNKQAHWFDNDGRRIKVSGEVHCKESGRPDDDYHYTEVYEYDPNIKIEAPIK